MRLRAALTCITILLLPVICTAEGLQLHSANPATSSPGESIQVFGAGFSSATRVVLGGQELTPTLLHAGQLQLLVPQLAEGEYSLQLIAEGKTSAQALRLRIESPVPSIEALSPSNINECSTAQERLVTIRGQNFQPGLHLFLNGATVPITLHDDQHLSFAVPPLSAGIYGLQVLNANGKRSLPHSLYFNNIPKIFSLSEGEDYVNFYQLIIRGKNFYPYSTLVVSEYPVGFTDLPPRQSIITGRDSGHGGQGTLLRGRNDFLNYVDCNTLIYYRFPYSRQLKQLSLQIINSDGKTSAIEQTSMP